MQCFGLAHVFVAETISSAVPCKGGLYIRQFGAVIVGNLLCFIIGLLVDVLKVIVSGCRDIKGPACSHRPKCFGAVVTYLGTAIFLAALKAIKKFGLCFDCDSFIALVQLWCDPGGTQEAPRKHPGGTQEAPRGAPRRHSGGYQEAPQGGTQQAPRRHPGGTLFF